MDWLLWCVVRVLPIVRKQRINSLSKLPLPDVTTLKLAFLLGLPSSVNGIFFDKGEVDVNSFAIF